MSTYAIRRHDVPSTFERREVVPSYAIRRPGLQTEIQQVVKRYIIDHKFKPGDILPGEGELARQIGISRPSLREAMKVLQTIGAVESRHGSGTFVGSMSLEPLTEGLAFQVGVVAQHSASAPTELLELIGLREAIETRQIRRAAGKHSAEDIDQLRRLNDDLESTELPIAFRRRDLELHLLFYRPLEDRIANEFIRSFSRISNLVDYSIDDDYRISILEEHDDIIDALEAGEADAAAAAMSGHFGKMSDAIQASYNPDDVSEHALSPIMDVAVRTGTGAD